MSNVRQAILGYIRPLGSTFSVEVLTTFMRPPTGFLLKVEKQKKIVAI